MAQASNITIEDGAATPVAHVFAPAKTQADMALFEDRFAGVYIGYNKLTMMLERPKGPSNQANRNLKLKVRLETPKLEVLGTSSNGITPAPTVAYRPQIELTATLPERCSLQDRKDIRALFANLLAEPAVMLAFENYELPY